MPSATANTGGAARYLSWLSSRCPTAVAAPHVSSTGGIHAPQHASTTGRPVGKTRCAELRRSATHRQVARPSTRRRPHRRRMDAMRSSHLGAVVGSVLCLLATACANPAAGTGSAPSTSSAAPVPTPTPEPDPVEEALAALDRREQVAQLIVVGTAFP